jgi:hypothetical protein
MITTNEALQYLNLDNSTDLKAIIENFIFQVKNEIENIIGCEIITNTQVRTFQNIPNLDYIPLDTFKLNSITSVKYSKDLITPFEVIGNSNYAFVEVNNIYQIHFFNNTLKNGWYELTTSEGVAIKDVPQEIKSVAFEMVAIKLKNTTYLSGGDRLGLSSQSASYPSANDSTSFKDLMPSWENKLRKYKTYNIF